MPVKGEEIQDGEDFQETVVTLNGEDFQGVHLLIVHGDGRALTELTHRVDEPRSTLPNSLRHVPYTNKA
jgi:hypothetical protein